MKKLLALMILALSAACAPRAPEVGIPTPIVITAEVSTVVPETQGPPPTEGPSPTPIPATPIPTLPSAGLSPTELKYMVLAQYPDLFFCDPDLYPVAKDNEMVLAKQHFAELQANQEEFETILRHTNISGKPYFTDQQRLTIYREHKKLSALSFQLVGETYQFQIQTGQEGQQGSLISGTIDASGAIQVQKQESTFPTCPICLAVGTWIDTPRGPVAVQDLQLGDAVWTMNDAGERVPGKILKLGSVIVPSTHQVIHLVLSDGRELWASPGHPTADGQRLSNVRLNDLLDGARVILVERLSYAGGKTYDILPSGDTGFYWANGILLDSTLSNTKSQ